MGENEPKDTATERIKKGSHRHAALGNDPKVRRGIKYRWLPVTNLAAVSLVGDIFRERKVHLTLALSASMFAPSLAVGPFHSRLLPICRPDIRLTNWGPFCAEPFQTNCPKRHAVVSAAKLGCLLLQVSNRSGGVFYGIVGTDSYNRAVRLKTKWTLSPQWSISPPPLETLLRMQMR